MAKLPVRRNTEGAITAIVAGLTSVAGFLGKTGLLGIGLALTTTGALWFIADMRRERREGKGSVRARLRIGKTKWENRSFGGRWTVENDYHLLEQTDFLVLIRNESVVDADDVRVLLTKVEPPENADLDLPLQLGWFRSDNPLPKDGPNSIPGRTSAYAVISTRRTVRNPRTEEESTRWPSPFGPLQASQRVHIDLEVTCSGVTHDARSVVFDVPAQAPGSSS